MRSSIANGAEGGRLPPDVETTVLIVEEDPGDLNYYASVLRRNGYLVRTCGSYDESKRLLKPGAYGLVVVGQGTHRFESRTVIEHSKEVDWDLPVLVVARYLEMHCYIEAIQMGAEDYLAGPLSESEILRAVSKYVQPWRPTGPATAGSA